MKTKTLLFSMALIACTFFTANAQKLILSEDFSTPEWQAEILRLNPGADEFGVPLNSNSTNPLPFAPPSPIEGANKNASYNNPNSTDLYFDKYKLNGDFEVIGGINSDVCLADGTNHNVLITSGFYEGQYLPFGFRMIKTTGYMELPVIASADTIILHVRGGNNDKVTELSIEKLDGESWTLVTTLPVQNRGAIWDAGVDELVKYKIGSSTPIKLRIVHNTSLPFFQIYQVDIQEFAPSAVKNPQVTAFKQIGRKLIVDQPTKLSLYNVVGSLVFEQQVVKQVQIPAAIGNGIFLVKTTQGAQKILLK